MVDQTGAVRPKFLLLDQDIPDVSPDMTEAHNQKRRGGENKSGAKHQNAQRTTSKGRLAALPEPVGRGRDEQREPDTESRSRQRRRLDQHRKAAEHPEQRHRPNRAVRKPAIDDSPNGQSHCKSPRQIGARFVEGLNDQGSARDADQTGHDIEQAGIPDQPRNAKQEYADRYKIDRVVADVTVGGRKDIR